MRIIASLTVVLVLIILPMAASAQAPPPVGVRIAAVGGAALNEYTPGVFGGACANNIGLLIRTWGKVTHVDSAGKYFYIDDGSGRIDGSGYTGLRVSCEDLAPGVTITPPGSGAMVAVTGISSTILIESKVQSNLRPRKQADIQTFAP